MVTNKKYKSDKIATPLLIALCSIFLAWCTFPLSSCNTHIPSSQKVSNRMLEDTAALNKHYADILAHLPSRESLIKTIRIQMNTSRTPGNRDEDYLMSMVTMQEKVDELCFVGYDSRTGWDVIDKEAIHIPNGMPQDDWWKEPLWKTSQFPAATIIKAVQQTMSHPRKTSQPESFIDLIVVDKIGILVHVVVPGYVDGPNGGFSISVPPTR